MKTKYLLLNVLVLFFLSAYGYSQEVEVSNETSNDASNETSVRSDSSKNQLRFSLGGLNTKVSGYTDAVFNDAHRFPLLATSHFIEFSKGNKTYSATQAVFGYTRKITSEHAVDGDILLASSGEQNVSLLSLGYGYVMDISSQMYLKPGAAFAFGNVSTELGEIDIQDKFPITLKDDTYGDGDKIEAKSRLSGYKLSVLFGYNIKDWATAFLTLEYWSLATSGHETTIGGEKVDDSDAFDAGGVNSDGAVYADYDSNIDPYKDAKIEVNPSSITVGFGYNF